MADDTRFFNRELSWLEFNQRVLDEACDESVPLLERLKFLAITASNLDEFFMVRVGGLRQLSIRGGTKRDPAGLTPSEQLDGIGVRARRLTDEQYDCWLNQLEPRLGDAGIEHLRTEDLNPAQLRHVEHEFQDEIVSVLAPLAVDSELDFPLLVNRSISLCVRLQSESTEGDSETEEPETRYALIPFGRSVRRFITVPSDGGYAFVLLDDVVSHFAGEFFPGETVLECTPFRITRNADLAVQEEEASDLLQEMEQLLVARKESDCVRLEIADSVSDELLSFLSTLLDVTDAETYRVPGPLDLSCLMPLSDAGTGDGNRYETWPPQPSPLVDPQESIFDVITNQDVLLYHPFDSFDPVVQLVEQAAIDPDVIAIKQTLYRTSRDSRIVQALGRGAQNGKHVTVIVELKARFDEERNIDQARALEQAGVQVFYGVRGLKTHSKVLIVIRREPQGIRRYMHFGTGNYNESTARLYSDASLLTCDDELGADAIAFFNAVTGYSQPQPLRRLAAAPLSLRERICEMIEAEIQFCRQGQSASISAKLNSLVDPEIIELLYRASNAGVRIRLNIRGICCLRPGIPGLSDRIEVVSLIDRFLEHARILHFEHGGDHRVFISSADWMPRNLDRRVELMVPVDDPAASGYLIRVLDACFQDAIKGRRLQPDGTYEKFRTQYLDRLPAQEWLFRETCRVVERAEQSRQTVFEPHRAPGSDD